MTAIEVLSFHDVVEAMPPDVHHDIVEWLEGLATIGWPGPQYIGINPARPRRPPCVWATGIRWSGEAYDVMVSSSATPNWDTLSWLQGCPIPPPISAYRWAAERRQEAA